MDKSTVLFTMSIAFSNINTDNHFQLVTVFTIFFNLKMELTCSAYSIKYSQTTHINYFLEPKPGFLVIQEDLSKIFNIVGRKKKI